MNFAISSKIVSKSIIATGYEELLRPPSIRVEIIRIHLYVPSDPGSDKIVKFYHSPSDTDNSDLTDQHVLIAKDLSEGMIILTQELGQGITVGVGEKLLIHTNYQPIYVNIFGAAEQIFQEPPI